MASPTPHTGIDTYTSADQFNLTTFDNNWLILDKAPGTFICTSTTRPGGSGGFGLGGVPGAWGGPQTGMRIFETDTNLTWRWTGSTFVRAGAVGYLGRITSTSTISTTDQWSPTSGGNYQSVISHPFSIPTNDAVASRAVQLIAEVPQVNNTNGLTWLLLISNISSTISILNSWPVWTIQSTGAGNASNVGTQGSFTTFHIPNANSVTYELAFAASPSLSGTYTGGGTSSLSAGASRPISLTAIEV